MSKFLKLVFLFAVLSTMAQAQWERIEMDSKGGNVNSGKFTSGNSHPLHYFLTPSAERDPSDTLLIATTGKNGGGITLNDYRIQVTQRELGNSYGRKVLEIDCQFWPKPGTAASKVFEGSADAGTAAASQDAPREAAVAWKSIVMESSPGMYRELYLIIDDGTFNRPLKPARILTVDGAELLATTDDMEGNGGYCTEGYWVLRRDGPWLLDFSLVRQEIARIVPANAQAMQMGCWAMSMEKETISAPVQEKNADCHACGWIGHVMLKFKIEGHSAVPVSAKFEGDTDE